MNKSILFVVVSTTVVIFASKPASSQFFGDPEVSAAEAVIPLSAVDEAMLYEPSVDDRMRAVAKEFWEKHEKQSDEKFSALQTKVDSLQRTVRRLSRIQSKSVFFSALRYNWTKSESNVEPTPIVFNFDPRFIDVSDPTVFHSSSGTFIAPITGAYVFSVQAYDGSPNDSALIVMGFLNKVSGDPEATLIGSASSGPPENQGTFGFTKVVRVCKGERVQVRLLGAIGVPPGAPVMGYVPAAPIMLSGYLISLVPYECHAGPVVKSTASGGGQG